MLWRVAVVVALLQHAAACGDGFLKDLDLLQSEKIEKADPPGDLSAIGSPLSASDVDGFKTTAAVAAGDSELNSTRNTCGCGLGAEQMFTALVPPGMEIKIGTKAIDYSSCRELLVGAADGSDCPGVRQGRCSSFRAGRAEADMPQQVWRNHGDKTVRVYYVVDGHAEADGGKVTVSYSVHCGLGQYAFEASRNGTVVGNRSATFSATCRKCKSFPANLLGEEWESLPYIGGLGLPTQTLFDSANSELYCWPDPYSIVPIVGLYYALRNVFYGGAVTVLREFAKSIDGDSSDEDENSDEDNSDAEGEGAESKKGMCGTKKKKKQKKKKKKGREEAADAGEARP